MLPRTHAFFLRFAVISLSLIGSAALAIPEIYDDYCGSCHQDDTPTCDGCHNHRRDLSAAVDAEGYLPGASVSVTLSGGSEGGWIRGLLYDAEGTEIDRAAGPTGTGDDGLEQQVTFPVVLHGFAPEAPGDYEWRAAYFGVFNLLEGTHDEEWVPVTVRVFATPDTSTAVYTPSWGRIKGLYRR